MTHESEPDAKKAKTLSDIDNQYMEAYLHYESCRKDDLKDLLRWNGGAVTGNKKQLLTRVIDGHCRGRLAKCSICSNGKLKIMDDGSKIKCSG